MVITVSTHTTTQPTQLICSKPNELVHNCYKPEMLNAD